MGAPRNDSQWTDPKTVIVTPALEVVQRNLEHIGHAA
jgi:hypothetical protein